MSPQLCSIQLYIALREHYACSILHELELLNTASYKAALVHGSATRVLTSFTHNNNNY